MEDNIIHLTVDLDTSDAEKKVDALTEKLKEASSLMQKLAPDSDSAVTVKQS